MPDLSDDDLRALGIDFDAEPRRRAKRNKDAGRKSISGAPSSYQRDADLRRKRKQRPRTREALGDIIREADARLRGRS